MKRRLLPAGLLFTILVGVWVFAQQSQPRNVRVRLYSIEQPSEIQITAAGGEITSLNVRKITAPFRSDSPATIKVPNHDAVNLQYPVEVSARKGSLLIIIEMPLEDYVAAVLAGESSSFRSEESLKAMAVAARTYAAHFLNRHKAEGFDFCDTTHCQDFRLTAVSGRLRTAVRATSDEVLQYNGEAIPSYYHQNCGGMPEPRAPYLRQTQDSFCLSQSASHWSAELTSSDLETALGSKEVQRIEVLDRTSSGRAKTLRISGSRTQVVDAEAFRLAIGRSLGWNKIRSDLYDIRLSPDGFVFDGRGSGHGMGLCQDGAAAMGEQGFTYKEILAYYYPNTTIHRSLLRELP